MFALCKVAGVDVADDSKVLGGQLHEPGQIYLFDALRLKERFPNRMESPLCKESQWDVVCIRGKPIPAVKRHYRPLHLLFSSTSSSQCLSK